MEIAALGDEASVHAAYKTMSRDTPEWEVTDILREPCRILARGGHVEAALRCIPKLGGSEHKHKKHTLEVYAAILEALLKK